MRGGVNADSVELFDHLYISRRNRQNDRFRVYHFIRRSFFTNTIIHVINFKGPLWTPLPPPQWGSTATLNGRGTRNLTLVFQVFVADLAYCFYSSAAELETTPKKKNLVSFFIEKMSTRFGRNCYDLIPLCFSFQTRSS